MKTHLAIGLFSNCSTDDDYNSEIEGFCRNYEGLPLLIADQFQIWSIITSLIEEELEAEWKAHIGPNYRHSIFETIQHSGTWIADCKTRFEVFGNAIQTQIEEKNRAKAPDM